MSLQPWKPIREVHRRLFDTCLAKKKIPAHSKAKEAVGFDARTWRQSECHFFLPSARIAKRLKRFKPLHDPGLEVEREGQRI